jgi:glutathione S-transferase
LNHTGTLPILIGMFDSPFVRRVAVSMRLLQIDFAHHNWSVGKDFERIRQFNPLGRVPTLVLEDGSALIESAAILDYLDERAGPAKALLPVTGPQRRAALQIMAIAVGAAEKAVLQVYETVFRPAEKRHEPWVMRCRVQMTAALDELEKRATAVPRGEWLAGSRMTQADITLACMFTFLDEAIDLRGTSPFTALRAACARCEALPEFKAFKVAFDKPVAPVN